MIQPQAQVHRIRTGRFSRDTVLTLDGLQWQGTVSAGAMFPFGDIELIDLDNVILQHEQAIQFIKRGIGHAAVADLHRKTGFRQNGGSADLRQKIHFPLNFCFRIQPGRQQAGVNLAAADFQGQWAFQVRRSFGDHQPGSLPGLKILDGEYVVAQGHIQVDAIQRIIFDPSGVQRSEQLHRRVVERAGHRDLAFQTTGNIFQRRVQNSEQTG